MTVPGESLRYVLLIVVGKPVGRARVSGARAELIQRAVRAAVAVMSGTSQQILNRVVFALGVALIVATGVVFTGHQTRSDAAGGQATGAPATATDNVAIKDFLYDPEDVTVAIGAKITFTNADGAPHTATSGESPKADGVFDTGTLTKGQSKSVKLVKVGTVSYYCAIHPFMKGTVTVK